MPDLPSIAGLNVALLWLKNKGIDAIASHEYELGSMLLDGLLSLKNLSLISRLDMQQRVLVFLFNIEGIDNGTLADRLSSSGFETRP